MCLISVYAVTLEVRRMRLPVICRFVALAVTTTMSIAFARARNGISGFARAAGRLRRANTRIEREAVRVWT